MSEDLNLDPLETDAFGPEFRSMLKEVLAPKKPVEEVVNPEFEGRLRFRGEVAWQLSMLRSAREEWSVDKDGPLLSFSKYVPALARVARISPQQQLQLKAAFSLGDGFVAPAGDTWHEAGRLARAIGLPFDEASVRLRLDLRTDAPPVPELVPMVLQKGARGEGAQAAGPGPCSTGDLIRNAGRWLSGLERGMLARELTRIRLLERSLAEAYAG